MRQIEKYFPYFVKKIFHKNILTVQMFFFYDRIQGFSCNGFEF